MTPSNLLCVIKWWVSSTYDVSLPVSELKCNCDETFPGVLCRFIIYLSFLFALSTVLLCQFNCSIYFASSLSILIMWSLYCSLSKFSALSLVLSSEFSLIFFQLQGFFHYFLQIHLHQHLDLLTFSGFLFLSSLLVFYGFFAT